MVGILLITHAPLGNAFITTAAHMFSGKLDRIEVIDVVADQEPFEVNALALEAIARLDDGWNTVKLLPHAKHCRTCRSDCWYQSSDVAASDYLP